MTILRLGEVVWAPAPGLGVVVAEGLGEGEE